jgi:hypothetical protein
MNLFRRVPLSFFTPERADELEAFAEKAQEFAARESDGANYLVDLFGSNEVLWDELLQEKWAKAHNPLIQSRGNLDMMGACILEGVDWSQSWDNVCWSHQQNLQNDFRKTGLHGLHFRMGVNKPSDRINCTMALAFILYRFSPHSFRASMNPVQGLSAFPDNRIVESGYFGDDSNYTWPGYESDSVKLLLNGAHAANSEDYRLALEQYLSWDPKEMSGHSQSKQAFKIEDALVPLVYNYGYRLKAAGMSNEDVLLKASGNIDALLVVADLNPQFKEALKRQILINMFSPFEDGLEMMDAKPEELQGVMLNPVLVDDPASAGFRMTLSGPVAVFGADQSCQKADRRTQIIEYFKDSPYEIDFEVAIHGLMAKSAIIVDLFAAQSGGHSAFMDEVLSGLRPPVYMDNDFLGHLMQHDRVKLYSDQAVLSLLTRSIDYLKGCARFSARVFMDHGFKSPDLTIKERPHLRDQVLQMLVEKEYLTADVFDWFGFGQRELKIVGAKAPQELKQHILHNALGL